MHAKNSEKFKKAGEFEYGDFTSIPNLFQAWNEFKIGKRKKKDVMIFERFLETNLFLRVKYYLRYADDFLILSESRDYLEKLIEPMETFLIDNLKLEFHPRKILFRKLDWGIDFLGYIVLPHYRLPRTKTKQRIFQKLQQKVHDDNFNQSLQSYLGYLSHAKSFKIEQNLKNLVWLWIHN